MKITKAEFEYGVSNTGGLPPERFPEVAFAGKSNVGKSSLLNRLVGRKRLAVTSSTPGRTRQINFFNINDAIYFVDLPGYGYAKVSKKEREKWGRLISHYFESRVVLRAVVVIIDMRRTPDELDMSLMEMLDECGVAPIVVATKADKLKKSQRRKRLETIARSLDIDPSEVVEFSAESGEGRDRLMREIIDAATRGDG